MDSFDEDLKRMQEALEAQDKQIDSIFKAEARYQGDNEALLAFWEKLWAQGGLKFNGTKWTYRIVDLYYKEKRYDDAWHFLNELVIKKPSYLHNTRKWQIKVLKREKKDYSHIQKLLDNGQ